MWSGLPDRGYWDALRADAEWALMKELGWDDVAGPGGSRRGRGMRWYVKLAGARRLIGG